MCNKARGGDGDGDGAETRDAVVEAIEARKEDRARDRRTRSAARRAAF